MVGTALTGIEVIHKVHRPSFLQYYALCTLAGNTANTAAGVCATSGLCVYCGKEMLRAKIKLLQLRKYFPSLLLTCQHCMPAPASQSINLKASPPSSPMPCGPGREVGCRITPARLPLCQSGMLEFSLYAAPSLTPTLLALASARTAAAGRLLQLLRLHCTAGCAAGKAGWWCCCLWCTWRYAQQLCTCWDMPCCLSLC